MGCDYFIVGGVYLDTLHEVPFYPAEDMAVRAVSVVRRRGGNASTTAVVLAQLAAGEVHWMGVVPAAGQDDDALNFVLSDMHSRRVDTSLREQVQPSEDGATLSIPAATIITSQTTGSRTIISSRRGMRELDPAHFASKLDTIRRPHCWIHFELRQYTSVLEMVRAADVARSSERTLRVSIEVEKPEMTVEQVVELIQLADVMFLSREWVEKHSASLLGSEAPQSRHAFEIMAALAARCSAAREALDRGSVDLSRRVICVCAWGAQGAYGAELELRAGAMAVRQEHFAAASKVAAVVDSTGAGDSFNAGVIAALGRGDDVTAALRSGCAVAGRKVAQKGFDGLAQAAALEAEDAGAACDSPAAKHQRTSME